MLVVLGAAGATGALAQTPAPASPVPALDERVVVTGTAAPVSAGAVGRTLAIVTADDLQRLPVASVTDALRLLPGVWVRQRGPFGSQTDISIRGASFGQTLVLIDGVRVNDPQTGHHNGDLPVALEDIARIELLAGAGSSLHGADAVGGVINIITRREASAPTARLAAGQYDLVQGAVAWRPATMGVFQGASASVDRSSGFAPARDFVHQQVRADFRFGRTTLAVSHLDKDFGAAGYYGPAPSQEWTTQTLVAARHQRPLTGAWSVTGDAWYRTHGDEFLYDPRVLGARANEHRTHVVGGGLRVGGRLSSSLRLTTGVEATGDWLRSWSLGDREEARVSGFGELEARVGRLLLYPSARVDAYTTFGSAFSPSLAVALPVRPRVKWRASVGKAFRVPTFTERFYTDPNHRANEALRPEQGWTADTGLDTYLGGTWVATVTGFVRRERDVIDWVRPDATVRWRTENIRDVRSHGFEAFARGQAGPLALGAQYTFTRVETDRLAGLSKYVDDYAPHGVGGDVSLALPWRLSTAARLEHRRPYGREAWTTVDLRVSRPIRRVTAFVEMANVGDAQYQEIRGVAMPGRWARAGITVK
ncbi:TonB-dependent receptor [Luteitalea sp. TBR-22]|nr:TonB-dependent receptor [Luteitalea sp. TBR-22]